MTHLQCYAGLSPDGRVILFSDYAAALTRAGHPPSPCIKVVPSPGFATDSALDDDPLDDPCEELNRGYARLLSSGGQPDFNPALTDDNFEGRSERTRTNAETVRKGFSATDPAAEDAALRKFKSARGWDSVDATTEKEFRRNFRLEKAYSAMLNEEQPLPLPVSANGGL